MLPSILLLLLFFAAQLLALVLTIIFFMPEISVAPLDPAVLMNLPSASSLPSCCFRWVYIYGIVATASRTFPWQ